MFLSSLWQQTVFRRKQLCGWCVRTCLVTASRGFLCFRRSKFQGEKVPTLREAVVESMRHNLIIYFDVKGHASQVLLSVLRHLPSPVLWVSHLLFCWPQTGRVGQPLLMGAKLGLLLVSCKAGLSKHRQRVSVSHSIILGSCNLNLACEVCECWVRVAAPSRNSGGNARRCCGSCRLTVSRNRDPAWLSFALLKAHTGDRSLTLHENQHNYCFSIAKYGNHFPP